MLSSNPHNLLPELERKVSIFFKNRSLLETAFVHTSYVNEHRSRRLRHNERLEFLGDAVLELVATEFLYQTFPETEEGQLTNFRSALVKGKHLAEVARHLGLGNYLLLSRGEERSGGREKNYILANVLEAFIGAIYLDCGFEVAHNFIHKFILTNLGRILEKGLHIDAKSKLQEYIQEKMGITPKYNVLEAIGPDHKKEFLVGAYVGDTLISTGKGGSKQKAEEEAAMTALLEKKWLKQSSS